MFYYNVKWKITENYTTQIHDIVAQTSSIIIKARFKKQCGNLSTKPNYDKIVHQQFIFH